MSATVHKLSPSAVLFHQPKTVLESAEAREMYARLVSMLSKDLGVRSALVTMLAERTAMIYAKIRDKESSAGFEASDKAYRDANTLWLQMHTALTRAIEADDFLRRAQEQFSVDVGAKILDVLAQVDPEVAAPLRELFAEALSDAS